MAGAAEEAEKLWHEGRHLNDLGQFAEAAELLDAARAVAQSSSEREAQRIAIRIDTTAALTDLELQGAAAAAERLGSARAAAERIGAFDLLAFTRIQHGVIDARSGLWAEASEQLQQVLPLFDHIGPVEQCSTLITLGFADLTLRRIEPAQEVLARACDIARSHELPIHLFKATHNLGCAAYIAGDLPEALRLMALADAMPVDVARERARIDFGAVLLEAGLVDQAQEALTDALRTARETGQRVDEGEILLDLARCAVADDRVEAARAHADAARTVFEGLGAEARRAAAELLIAGLDAREGVNLAQVLELCDAFSDTSAELADAVLVRAEAHLALGELASCEADLAGAPESGLLSQRVHELYVRARLADRSSNDAEFQRTVHESSQLTASAQGTMRSLEVRAAIAQHVAPTAALDLQRALSSGDGGRVFATVERWRAASQRSLAPAVDLDGELTESLARLRWLRSPVAQELDPAAAAAEAAELERAIALATWKQGASASWVDRPIELDELYRALPAGTGYVTFTATSERCRAIAVGPEGERIVDLAEPGEVHGAVRALRRDLRGAAYAHGRVDLRAQLSGAVAASAGRLSELIMAPSLRALGGVDRLVIVPNDILHAVPWAALPGVEGRPVTVAPSATVWARLSRVPPPGSGTVHSLAGPRVRRGVEESLEVAEVWRHAGVSAHADGAPASAAEAAAALGSAEIVHVAAHGHHAEDNPLFSSLLMADGPIFAHELVGGVGAQHVVLSACDVGRARVRAGGEALGLTAALLALGVRSVVAAVAPIPDEVSAAAAVAYHREVVRGSDAASALATAIAATPGAEALCCFGGSWRWQGAARA